MHSSLFTSIRKLGLAVAALGFCFAAASAHAQIDPSSPAAVDWSRIANAGAPTAPCPTSTVKVGQPYTDTTNNINYTCGPSGWFQSSGSSGSGLPSCSDTSGSGTAQTCTTSPSFTPTGNQSCILYHTTTSNSGTGLTVNVNSAGAKSVAIAGSSGWTTTLTSGVIPSAKPVAMCYDGTNWDVLQTGTAASSGGGGSYTNVVASATSDTTVAIINGKCSVGQSYLLNTTASLTAGGTLNCPVIHAPGGQWNAGSAISITLAGGLSELAPYIPTKMVGTNITIAFSGSTETHAPVEWWGAVADWNGSTGTDNTTTIQACLTAHPVQCDILYGAYKITSALSITTSNTGIHGAVMAYNPTGSMIVQTTTSADIIVGAGANAGSPLYNTYLDHFTYKHSAMPTGTAKGLSLSFLQSAYIDHVVSQDSVYPIYLKNFQNSVITDSAILWTFNYSGGPTDVYGIYVDGAAAPQSIQLNRVSVNWLGSNATSHGFYATGSDISDIFADRLQVSNTNYGIEVIGTGGGGFHESDILFNQPVINGVTTSCIVTSGLTASDRGTGVQFIGGNCTASGGTKSIDIGTSQGVQFVGMQVTPANTSIAVKADGSAQLTFQNLMITGATNTTAQIVLNNTQGSTVGGTVNWTGAGVGATFTGGSTGNTINLALTGGTASATGMTFDGTSGLNNAIPSTYNGTITTAVTDTAGTNKWCDSTACHNVNGISGMTSGQVAVAGSASTVTSSKALAGSGAGVATGPTTSVSGDCVQFTGTSGQISDAGAPCGTGSGSYPPPQTITASGSAALNFTSCISGGYRDYEIRFDSLIGASNPTDIYLQFSSDGGSTYDTTSAHYQWGKHFTNVYGSSGTSGDSTNQTASGVTLSGGGTLSTATATSSLSGRITLFDLGNTSLYKFGVGQSIGVFTTDPQTYVGDIGYQYRQTAAVNAFRIIASSGNIASGSVTCQPLPQ